MLTPTEQDELRRARWTLEHPGLAMRIADKVGRPVGWLLDSLPKRASGIVNAATAKALNAALRTALRTLDARASVAPSDRLHRSVVVATGAAGGLFGFAALAVELPISTTFMLRSIAEQARAQGEDLGDPATRLECISVFALGGSSREDDEADAGYYAVRLALSRAVAEAAEHIAGRGLTEAAAGKAAPALARLVAAVAQRFGIAVSDKFAAQAMPVVGAAGGAAVNLAFMAHFQDVARAHFTVRRLERRHGAGEVRAAYERLG